MESIVLWVVLIGGGYYLYRLGKRTGSRKGYHVGLKRGSGRSFRGNNSTKT